MKILFFSVFFFCIIQQISPYTLGVDVSAWDEDLDWNKIKKAGVKFAILRASVRRSVDTYFEKNYNAAKKAGVTIAGVYYYTYSMNANDCAADADFVVQKLGGKKVPIFFDMEEQTQADLGPRKVTDMMKAFIKRCKSHGYKCHIYTNKNWYVNYFYPKELASMGCKFWVASYGLDDGTMNTKYKPNVGEWIWQYTSVGKLKGLSNQFDMNAMYGSTPDPDPEPEPTVKSLTKMVKITTTDGVNIRSKPEMNASNIIGLYYYGDRVQVTGITSDKAFYKDKSGHYFTTISDYVADLKGKCNVAELNVRESASTSSKVVDLLTKGKVVSILKEKGDWCYVKVSSSVKGWCYKQYITYQ